jgi:amino acid permease
VAVLSLFCCSTGACLANYALGVGVLGMPYAFSQSGLVLGAVVMVVITAIGIITATWLIDVRSRAAAELAIASCVLITRSVTCRPPHGQTH